MRLQASLPEPGWPWPSSRCTRAAAMPTMVVDPRGRQVPWIGQGHPRETARAFLQQLSAGVAERIKAVAIDMTTAYGLEIKTHCPQAEIVYDLLHVVAKYGREVIDRVRVGMKNRKLKMRSATHLVKYRHRVRC